MLGFRILLGILVIYFVVLVICIDTSPEIKKGEGIFK